MPQRVTCAATATCDCFYYVCTRRAGTILPAALHDHTRHHTTEHCVTRATNTLQWVSVDSSYYASLMPYPDIVNRVTVLPLLLCIDCYVGVLTVLPTLALFRLVKLPLRYL